MSTSAQAPQDHPLMRAWNAYKATPEYANSKIWAQHAEHVDGSLWALFMAGWQAAIDAALRGEVKGLASTETECDLPPRGWRCTRGKGHSGPCAAVECPWEIDIVERAMKRLRGEVKP